MRNYKCEFPDCEQECRIRSKVKDRESEYYGLYVCNTHAQMLRKPKTSTKTSKTVASRKEQRKEYPEFYTRHCEQAQGTRCLECGARLQGNSTEIPHILSKSIHPEVATDDDNILKYLCGDCHTRFDSSLSARSQMKCFLRSVEQYQLISQKLKKSSSESRFYDEWIINHN